MIWASRVYAETLPCEHEPALDIAATAIATNAKAMRSDVLLDAVRDAGSDLVQLRGKLLEGGTAHESMIRDWMLSQRKELDGDIVCGVGRAHNRSAAILAARAGALVVRFRHAQQLVFVQGDLKRGFREPSIVVEDIDHHMTKTALDLLTLKAGLSIPFEARPIRVQLVAVGPHGLRPVAERVLGKTSKVELPSGPGWKSLSDVERAHAEFRHNLSLSMLRTNQLVARAAAQHAQRVCVSGIVGHAIDQGLGPEQRLRNAGLSARAVGEVISRADSLERAWLRLLESPSHRMVLEDIRLTDYGWGLARAPDDSVCIVGLFAAWPRPTSNNN
jgi:hypothetical protein